MIRTRPAPRTGEASPVTAFLASLQPQPWMRDANCAGTDPDAFFPKKGGSVGYVLRICAACPVRRECREYGLTIKAPWGIWGGRGLRPRRDPGKSGPDRR